MNNGKKVNFNDSGQRRIFFEQAYKYICKKQNCEVEFDDRLNEGAFSAVGVVKEEKKNEHIIKINDYIKTYISLSKTQVDGSGTIPSFNKLDDLSKKEVSFLLDVRNKEFDEEEKYVELETGASKEELREGAGNIIEILGYGKIDCGELKKDNDADIHLPDDNTYTITPFRFYEMPYLRGISKELWSLKDALALGIDIGNALCCVHDEELFNVGCHGDIKLANILYVSSEDKYDPCKYVLTDFNTIHYNLKKTRPTGEIGTPVTMPPEMFGSGKNGPRYSYTVDYYSLAASIYCMLNGGRYPDPNGEVRRNSENKKPYSFPGFEHNGNKDEGYVDPTAEASKKKVTDMLKEEHSFGSSEAEAAVEVYMFIVKQLEYDKKDRAIHPEEGESAVECTRRVKNTYLGFLYELGNACLEDKNYDRAAEYFGRYISRQERELRYILSDEKRENDSDLIAGYRQDLLDARCRMGLSLIRSKIPKDSEKILALADEIESGIEGEPYYKDIFKDFKGTMKSLIDYSMYLALEETEADHGLLHICLDIVRKNKDDNGYRDFYLKDGVVDQDRLHSVFQTLKENEDEEMMRDIFEEFSSLWEGEELPSWIGGFINTVTYTVKYETEEAGQQPKERTYTTYSLHGQECIQETDLLLAEEASVCRDGYKVDEEHSDYPKTGEAVSDRSVYTIRLIKDYSQKKFVHFTVVYKCEGQEAFSVKRKREIWSGDELRYSSDLAELPEEYAGKYSVEHVNMDEASVISDGSSILAECERIYVDTECVIKHVCDGVELAKDTFRSRCWAGDDERTVVLTEKALEPNEYRGYRFEKTEPKRLSAGDKVKDGAEIRLIYRKALDDVKTVFYAVTYYKDGKECDSTIQRQQKWAGADDKLMVSSEIFAADRYEGYELEYVEPDVRECGEIQSGSLLDVYYVRESANANDFKNNCDGYSKNSSQAVATATETQFKEPVDEKNEVMPALKNPRIVKDTSMDSGQKVTWDCIWFGSYPQSEVVCETDTVRIRQLTSGMYENQYVAVSSTLWDKITSAEYDENEDAVIADVKYRRLDRKDDTYVRLGLSGYYKWGNDTVRYFKYEPIKWRVLNVNGNDALLIADKALDCKSYNEKDKGVTWKTCTMRSWLNGYDSSSNRDYRSYTKHNFINTAFTSSERSAIKKRKVLYKTYRRYSNKGGYSTRDKIFLLSKYEVKSITALSYGFVKKPNVYDEALRCKSSMFAKAMGTYSEVGSSYAGNCEWWLRSPYYNTSFGDSVYFNGLVYNLLKPFPHIDGVYSSLAVRPALHLDFSSPDIYRYAGTVCSDGSENSSHESSKSSCGDADEDFTQSEEPVSKKKESGHTIKRLKKVIAILLAVAIACIAMIEFTKEVIIPNINYNKAVDLMNSGDYKAAMIAFDDMNGFKDSKKLVADILDENPELLSEHLKLLPIGGSFTFGSYEQDNEVANGKEDIEWIVLAKEDEKLLAISKYALDCQPYNTEWVLFTTWEECSLRKWLNETFINEAFSSEEVDKIATVTVPADQNPAYNTNPGNDTRDQVFILSVIEAEKYFSKDEDRECKLTVYAEAKSTGSGLWRLRSPGYDTSFAAHVHDDGRVCRVGNSVNYDDAVRPALWIDLKS